MQKYIWLLCFLSSFACAHLPDATSEQELLFARRIIELWQDQETLFTQQQIELFLTEYPTSNFADHFHAILGDIALKESRFADALNAYQKITSADIRKQVRLKKWHALYQQTSYATLYEELAPIFSFLKEDEELFYFAESAFREGHFEEALSVYSRLQENAQFGSHAQLAMAEIYRHLNQCDKAAALYLTIAHEKKSHQTLFYAATMLAQCDPPKALELFGQIAKGGGKKAPEAAYHWLQLLAKQKQWEVLLKEKRCFLSTLSEQHLPIYYFYCGMFCYDKQQWTEAISALQKSLEGGLKPPHDKNALLALLTSSKESGLLTATESAYALLQDRYPEYLEEGAMLRAISYRKAGDDQRALELLTELIAMAQTPHVLQQASLEKIHLLMQQKLWPQAHTLASQFLSNFPESSHHTTLLRLMVDLSLANLTETTGHLQLAQDLERALAAFAFTEEELDGRHLLLAKCYFKLDKLAAARQLLEKLSSSEAHYLLALCYMKEGSHPEKVIFHGEKALSSHEPPLLGEVDRLHLYLFNAYLEMSKKQEGEEFAEKAAAHLFAVSDTMPISLENRLWLAHMYAKQERMRLKAIKILETILPTHTQIERFQQETLLLATLYEHEERYLEAVKLLDTLRLVCTTPQLLPKIGLQRARVHKACGELAQAQALLEPLETHPDPAIAYAAQLESARLGIMQGAEAELVLKKLRDIWVHKILANEPIHLEAALDYVAASATFFPNSSSLAALEEIKEHFISQTDIWSKDYHEARLADPAKDQIYQAYMRYIEAQLYLAQAREAKEALDAEIKQKVARALFTSLRQQKYAVSKYLTNRVEKSAEGL